MLEDIEILCRVPCGYSNILAVQTRLPPMSDLYHWTNVENNPSLLRRCRDLIDRESNHSDQRRAGKEEQQDQHGSKPDVNHLRCFPRPRKNVMSSFFMAETLKVRIKK